jgi:hypothetical protein
LEAIGVARIFTSGSAPSEIVDWVRQNVGRSTTA